MHKNRMYKRNSNYAIILFAISFGLIVYGLVLDYQNNQRLFDPVKDVISISDQDDSTIHVDTTTPSDTTNTTTSTTEKPTETTTKPSSNTTNTTTNTTKPSTGTTTKPSTGTKNNTSKPKDNATIITRPSNNNQPTGSTTENKTELQPKPLTIEDINNNLRREIENTYSITIKYGAETQGYSVAGISTNPIYDSNVINNQLTRLKNCMSVYPRELFREIKNGGIPLTVMLINSYADNTITGVTDSSYNDAIISIAAVHPFEDSFFHESYHYIERYLFKKGANYNSWDSFNPADFAWGTINGSLSYSNTFSPYAPFVNNYAQSAAAEDRASTFEYMMASSKASCLNNSMTVWRKGKLLADTMDLVLSSVRPDVTEYWERYL